MGKTAYALLDNLLSIGEYDGNLSLKKVSITTINTRKSKINNRKKSGTSGVQERVC